MKLVYKCISVAKADGKTKVILKNCFIRRTFEVFPASLHVTEARGEPTWCKQLSLCEQPKSSIWEPMAEPGNAWHWNVQQSTGMLGVGQHL